MDTGEIEAHLQELMGEYANDLKSKYTAIAVITTGQALLKYQALCKQVTEAIPDETTRAIALTALNDATKVSAKLALDLISITEKAGKEYNAAITKQIEQALKGR